MTPLLLLNVWLGFDKVKVGAGMLHLRFLEITWGYFKRRTFFVYCSHATVQMLMCFLASRWGISACAGGVLLLGSVTIMVCLFWAYIMESCMPRIMSVVCGGRVK